MPKYSILPPRVPSGDSCQAPKGMHASAPALTGPRLTDDPTTLKDKCPTEPQGPPRGTANRAGRMGAGDGLRWQTVCRETGQSPGTGPPPQLGSHLPGTTFIGDSSRSPWGRQEWVWGVGGSQAPSEAAESGQWWCREGGGHRRALSAAASVSMGEGKGGQGAREI